MLFLSPGHSEMYLFHYLDYSLREKNFSVNGMTKYLITLPEKNFRKENVCGYYLISY